MTDSRINQTAPDLETPTQPDPDIIRGLVATQAGLPPKLFYDVLGSTLFTAICLLPEYYQTRTEAAIFSRYGRAIAKELGPEFRLVDLGAGDCRKAAGLMPVLKPTHYTPIDISGDFLAQAADAVAAEFPSIMVQYLVRDFTVAWELPAAMREQAIVYFYPGSSIGNFDPQSAVQFLKNLRRTANGQCHLLIGVDTVKAPAILEAAYDDALGVTAAFNRNMLLNANRRLGTNFKVSQWSHQAVYDRDRHRIEMHLVAREPLQVQWPGGQRAFAQGDTIHTENSYKYTPDSFAELLDLAGFSVQNRWQDDRQDFLVLLARAG